MHYTASLAGLSFAESYGSANKIVIDVGGQDVNGSLRKFFQERGMKYICIDMVEHPSVDIIVKPGDKFPFEDGSVDLIVTTSCFEHDPCFWMTFKEMSRILKLGGHIYVNAPTNGSYHTYPGDNWRFYSDAGQALAYWSGIQMGNETVYPMKVIETFHILPQNDEWMDFICVWERVENKETQITVSAEVVNNIGPLERAIHTKGLSTKKKC